MNKNIISEIPYRIFHRGLDIIVHPEKTVWESVGCLVLSGFPHRIFGGFGNKV